MHTARTASEDETARLGERLGAQLRAGDIVLVEGPLGAGKTVLVRGMVRALDPAVAELVSSQSYVIVGEYATRPATVHLDLYRVKTVEEVVALGWEELLHAHKIAFVEWPLLLEPLLEPDDPVARIALAPEGEHARRVTMTSSDPRLDAALALAAAGC